MDGSSEMMKRYVYLFSLGIVAFILGLGVMLWMAFTVERNPDGTINYELHNNQVQVAAVIPFTTAPVESGIPRPRTQVLRKNPPASSEILVVETSDNKVGNAEKTASNQGTSSIQNNDANSDEEAEFSLVPELRRQEGPRVRRTLKTKGELAKKTAARSSANKSSVNNTDVSAPVDTVKEENDPLVAMSETVPEISDALEGPQLQETAEENIPQMSLDKTTVAEDTSILPDLKTEKNDPIISESKKTTSEKITALPRKPIPSKELLNKALVKYHNKVGQTVPNSEEETLLIRHYYNLSRSGKVTDEERYALLDRALFMARRRNDSQLANDLINELTSVYEVNGLEIKFIMLKDISRRKGLNEKQIRLLMDASLLVMNEAILEDRYEMASMLADEVYNTCSLSHAIKERPVAFERKITANQQWERWQQFQYALKILEKDAEDQKSNMVVALWYCEIDGNLNKAIPYFAKGTDSILRQVANLELQLRRDPASDSERLATAQMKLADQWWDIAKNQNGTLQGVFQSHAVDIYSNLDLKVASRFDRGRIEKRLESVKKL